MCGCLQKNIRPRRDSNRDPLACKLTCIQLFSHSTGALAVSAGFLSILSPPDYPGADFWLRTFTCACSSHWRARSFIFPRRVVITCMDFTHGLTSISYCCFMVSTPAAASVSTDGRCSRVRSRMSSASGDDLRRGPG